MEGCESGLISTLGKRVWPKGYRGFESRPFRLRPTKLYAKSDSLKYFYRESMHVF